MRKYALLLCLIAFGISAGSFAQGTLNYKLLVYDTQGKPKANLDIVLIETSTFQRKNFKTNGAGEVLITLNEGAEWMVHIGDMKNHTLLKVPSGSGNASATVTYDVAYWNRINQPPVDRSKLNLTIVQQTSITGDMPAPTHSFVEIHAVNGKDVPWQGIEVRLTCYKTNEQFVAKTDARGVARFNVPNSQNYQIDLDGQVDFEYIDLGAKSIVKKLKLTYEKIDFVEKVNVNGFIEQTFTVSPKPVSNRVMVTLFIRGGAKGGVNEDVYLDMNYGNQKFHGVTDAEGKVVFLLPSKRSYLVSFRYEKNVGNLDLTRFRGIGSMQRTFYYQPDPRLEFPERFLPTASEITTYDINSLVTQRYPDIPEDELINVHVKWGNNKINSGSLEALLELGFSVKVPPIKTGVSKPLNIAFVLERSGSMGGENIDLLKEAMLKFIGKLGPQDKVSLVFFDDEAVIAYPISLARKKDLIDIISAVQVDGGTNIYAGLKLGYEQVAKTFDPASTNRVILLTDGYGGEPIEYVLEESKKYFEKGISVSTIGVGAGCNQPFLSLISKYSGGLEHQAINSNGISVALENEFESLFYPLASDLKVTVKYNNRIIYKTLYGVPESKNSAGIVEFKLDRVYSTMNKMALLKFKIENPTRDIDKDKITIQVDYFDEQKQKAVQVIKETNLVWTDETDLELIHDEQLKKIYSLALINQAMKAIADLCDAKNYTAARENIKATIRSIDKIGADKLSADLKPFIDELQAYLEALNRAIANKK